MRSVKASCCDRRSGVSGSSSGERFKDSGSGLKTLWR